MKVKLGYGVEDDIACMREIGGAIAGKPITLMVDTNHAYGRAEALRPGRALEEYALRRYEEPVVPEDIEGYVEMRAKRLRRDKQRSTIVAIAQSSRFTNYF